MKRIPMNGDEQDALTRAKRFLRWRPGVRAQIKRQYNKRLRKKRKEAPDD